MTVGTVRIHLHVYLHHICFVDVMKYIHCHRVIGPAVVLALVKKGWVSCSTCVYMYIQYESNHTVVFNSRLNCLAQTIVSL